LSQIYDVSSEQSPPTSAGIPFEQWSAEMMQQQGSINPGTSQPMNEQTISGPMYFDNSNIQAPIFDPMVLQQPFIPVDLWQMPLTLEWDWAGMTSQAGAFNGIDPNQQQFPTNGDYDGQL
jgi:hypothetical protein